MRRLTLCTRTARTVATRAPTPADLQSVHTELYDALVALAGDGEWRDLTTRLLVRASGCVDDIPVGFKRVWVNPKYAADLSILERLRYAELCVRLRAEALARIRSGEWEGWGHWLSGPRLTRIPIGLWRRDDVELCPLIDAVGRSLGQDWP